MYKYALALAGGIAVGIVVAVLLRKKNEKMKNNNGMKNAEELLIECFGESMYTNELSIKEVRDWIKVREDNIKAGSKAVIMKVNNKTLNSIGKKLNIGDVENNVVIAIVNGVTKEIDASALIKYEKLDAKLESALSKGDGVLVVEA